jgi:diguanylate cyclase (GGDEF)-like protein/putative nucleotidyltransferase with HDIG domain
MPDRLGGDAFEGADAAPMLLAPGLSAETAHRLLWPIYLTTIAVFLAVSVPHGAIASWTASGQVVWLVAIAMVLRSGWVVYRWSDSVVERRFWGFLLAATLCVGVSQGTYLVELLTSGPSGPPLATLSTVFDVLTILVLIGLLASFARFRQSTWAARARYVVDIVAACVVSVGVLDDWLVGPAFAAASGGRLAGAIYSVFPVVGALVLAGTLWVVTGTRYGRWQSWERRIAGASGVFAFALLLSPAAYSDFFTRVTGGWAPIVLDVTLLSALLLGLSAVVHRLAEHEVPWRLRPLATLEPSYGWIASVVLPSIELIAIPAFGIAAFQTGDPTERLFRLAIVGIVSVMLALRTLFAVADSEALLARADTDPLTGLLNHRLFHGRLNVEIDRASRHGESVGLVALDIDDFGAVNSVGGHQAGDTALVAIARAIEAAVRSQDIVCRVGGDELMVILPGADLGATFVTARRIVEGVRSVDIDAVPPLSVSAGVTAYPEHALDHDRLLVAADAALYWAKRHGKDRAVLYDDQVATPVTPEQRIKELREHANLESVRALAAAVDARDPGTQDHSRNVSQLAAELARDIGLDGETVTLIGYAGQLHDVGKIGVPDSVLRKGGVLTEHERLRLREHASLGAQIIAAANISEIQPWVRHHHERWDGTGYPDGLAGEDIPLGARLLALAEAYDSLVTGRSGRRSMTPRVALQQVDLDLGGKFDPVIGERFILMVTAQLSAAAGGRRAR